MAATSRVSSAHELVQPLENGDRLCADEYLHRYEAMPDVNKAELIEGIVYRPSPVRLAHAAPDTLMQGWLLVYAARTPGTQAAGNVTVRLDRENVPQPDVLLRILPSTAASSAAIDLHDKFHACRRAGAREYLVWRPLEGRFDWFVLDGDEYRSNDMDSQGVLRSPCARASNDCALYRRRRPAFPRGRGLARRVHTSW